MSYRPQIKLTSDGDMLQLGDVQNLSTSASVMLKVSILAAWAELQIASTSQVYLIEVIKPYRWLLGPFWVGALRDYALLRTDPEMGAAPSAGMDLSSGMGRDVLLPYYEKAVPKLLHAVAIGLANDDPFIVGAIDGQTFTSAVEPKKETGMARPEPSTNFYIIYGLAFESLTRAIGSDRKMAMVALRSMTSLVQPKLSGTTVFDGAFFDELITLCYRIAMSEPARVKAEMVEVVCALATSRKDGDQAQLRRALAVIAFVLRETIPSRDTKSSLSSSDPAADRVAFLRAAFASYVKIVEVMDMGQRADLCAVAIHLFAGKCYMRRTGCVTHIRYIVTRRDAFGVSAMAHQGFRDGRDGFPLRLPSRPGGYRMGRCLIYHVGNHS